MNEREIEMQHMVAEFVAHKYVYPDHLDVKAEKERREPKNRHPFLRTVSVKRTARV